MLKPLLVLAVTANLFFIPNVSATASSSASNGTVSSSSSPSTSSSNSSDCEDDESKLCPKPNEVYDLCPAPCPPRRCDVDERVIRCAAPPEIGDPECNPGCRCADDYVRNDKGICVTRAECPVKCKGPNEVFDTCPAPCPPQRCDVDIALILCAVPPQPGDPECEPGCRCIDNYVRNSSGICIPRDQCEPECGKNERYEKCPASLCGPQKCSELGYGENCTSIDENTPCPVKPGCVCRDDYVRNDKGVCIPRNKCPSCKGDPNKQTGCGTYCNQRCSNIGQEPQGCILICYPNSCDCKEGYYLDDNTGKCVLPKECTRTCGKHEVFSDCINGGCDARNCSQLGYPVPCVKPKKCIKGCVCENNYLRNDKGVCVPRLDCPSCGGDENAQAGCGSKCKRCSNYHNKGPVACPLICMLNGCDCKNGYVYDENIGKCVLPKNCSPVCGPNEVYQRCITKGCADKNKCSSLGYDVICKEDKNNCTQGCLCKNGYMRDSKGVCIPKDQCPSCGGDPNAKPGCGVNCGKHCADYFGQPVPCEKICHPNGCDCKENFYYGENQKKCVPANQCTRYCNPDKNEVYSECINGGCQAKNCSQLGAPIPCIKLNISSCIKGCLCKQGYLRASNGSCIPEDQCKPCKRPHEYYYTCPSTCPPQTCESIGKAYSCPLIPAKPSSKYCKPACRCEKGYFRNKIGECISKADCLTCTGPHEYFSCGGACDNVCATIKKQNQTNCPIINITCNRKCYCEKDYARAKNNTCIPISRCTELQCGVNEQYVTCPPAVCRPQNCSQVGFPVACPDIPKDSKCPSKPGCICVEGYVRNDKGICIPLDQCPSCRGDRNAKSGCGFCGHRCSDIGKDVACLAICEANGCECRKGHYYDDVQGKCVLAKNCTPQCGVNEQYSTCPAGLCRPQNCSQVGFPISCSIITPDTECPVKPGCICNDGYARNNKGFCIPLKQCPSCAGDPNATSGCGYCGHRCSDIGKSSVPCPRICIINGCQCKKGHYYDGVQKKCVPPTDCTPHCGENEVPSNCVNGGCDRRNCTQLGQPKICIDPIKCKKGCVCKQGYLRDAKGVCVPIKDCQMCGGDPNARTGCGINCNRHCSDLGKETQVCIQQCNEDGCDCNDGYYFDNITGKCVKPENCSCPKPNEVFDLCPYQCPPRTSESLDRAYICPIEYSEEKESCKPACRCKDGYYRNINGQCNTEAQCRQCNGPHEYYNCGVACDNVCDTLSEQNQTHCPIMNIVCNKKCYCEKGHARAKNNTCIPISKCNEPQCDVNEVYEKYPSKICRPETCSELGYSLDCEDDSSDSDEEDEPECVCKDGYVRNKKDVCIPKYKCPSCAGDRNATAGCGFCFAKQCPGHGEGISCAAVCDPNGCVCKKHFLYDRYLNKCVAPRDCTLICPKNEVPSNCINGGCDKRNCTQLGQPDICIDVIKCYKGCVCKKGYLRNNEGICVPISKCPPTCPKNEVYNNCVEGYCEPKNCSQVGYPIKCPRIHTNRCTGGCLCKDGYVRDDNGTCIPIKLCPSCGGDPNALSGCGVHCNRRCRDIGNEDSAGACIELCRVNSCDCKPGFYFDDNTGLCVLPKDCTPVCGEDEVYNSCLQGQCNVKNCSQLGYPISCPRINPDYCIKGCLCKGDKVRADNGTCIPKSQCPSCGGDPNAVSGCGKNCNKLCEDVGKKPKPCNDTCESYINRCDCREGFYLEPNTLKCVRSQQCTRECNLPHEVFDPCPATCPPQTCSSIGKKFHCPRILVKGKPICKGACRCEKNYYRNQKGECISREQCLKCKGPHEYFSCGTPCDNECSKLDTQDKKNCPIKNKKCTEKCYCEDGFARNDSNICIPIADCKYPCPIEDPTTTTTPAPPSANVTELLAKLRRANIALTGQFLYDMVNSNPDKSFVLSAISVLIIFTQLLLYSVGLTREQLLHVTNLNNNEDVKEVIPALLKNYQMQVNVTFEVAIKCYGNIYYPFSEQFIQDSDKIFNSTSEVLDFGKNVQAANTINKWVENVTHDQIKDLIPASALNAGTRLVLVNAMFYYGNWKYPFNVKNTQNRDFYITPNKTIPVPTMYQENRFNYCEFAPLDIKVLEMFYEDTAFSFVIWLSNQYDGLNNMVDKMRDPDLVAQSLDCLRSEKVKVYVPKMDILTELNVVELSKKANVTEMFRPQSNDFRGMLKNEEPIYVSDGIQKCKIQSDEKGTLAAVATGIIVGTTSAVLPPPQTKIFEAHHPYAFTVFGKQGPLFTGVFSFIGVAAAGVAAPPRVYEFNANHRHAYCVCRDRNPIFCGGFLGM